jgi:hypothetical protein
VPAFIETAKQSQGLSHSNFLGELRFLQLNADTLTQRAVVSGIPMLAQQLHNAFVRIRKAFEYFNGGCFAGAIWAKQPETLTREDFQI